MTVLDAAATVAVKPLFGLGEVGLTVTALLVAAPRLLLSALRDRGRIFGDFVALYAACRTQPLGRYVFRFFSLVSAPYSMSVGPSLDDLHQTPDGGVYCAASMVERPWHRNPFSCIHAAAVTNLGEYTGAVGMLAYMQRAKQRLRGIVGELRVVFKRKARGKIVAVCRVPPVKELKAGDKLSVEVPTELFDSKGELVAVVTAVWDLSLRESRKA
mmetsp:Transcript_14742/g.41760  ORF Transcript_14742/g.41760 Transcript_14742/m.41760 type:complete len:214 (-) Transcript_14742:124-765(-)